jgi:uncharacterized membrane protein YgaE (UPF0421/DUF939 family)
VQTWNVLPCQIRGKGVTLSTIEGHLLLYYHAAVVWVYDPEVPIFAQIATQSGLSPGTASRAALATILIMHKSLPNFSFFLCFHPTLVPSLLLCNFYFFMIL